ncbi:MAG: T9SS type A sorting domain-containing protein [Ignavibacteriales bacterium]|nr:T9SS type A sorting domain-containing protein [Ignavibacteriales bacterium]
MEHVHLFSIGKAGFFYKTKLLALIILLLGVNQFSYSQKMRNISFSKSSLEVKLLKADDGNEYQKFDMNDFMSSGESGQPDLPVKYLRLLIPSNEDVANIVVNVKNKETIKLTKKIYPSQPDIPTSLDFKENKFVKPDSKIYDSEKPFPEEIIKIKDDGYFDGTNHIVTLEIYPVRYYPKLDYVEFHDEIEFSLQMKNSSKQFLVRPNRKEKYDDLYENALKELIDNDEDIALYSSSRLGKSSLSVTGPLPAYEYVVITSNALSQYFNKFINWKRRKGLNIGLVTVEQISANYTGDLVSGINDEAGKIRQYLKDSYASGTVWALLGGDYSVVPIRYGAGYIDCAWDDASEYRIPADIYFADFNGDWNVDGIDSDGKLRYGEQGGTSSSDSPDYNPEIFVGRLLCSTSQEILNWTDKLILYEQNPGKGDNAYVAKSFMIQSDQMQGERQAQNVSALLTSFTHEIWEESPSYYAANPSFPTAAGVIAKMNNHYGLWSWFGHGTPKTCTASSDSVNTTPSSQIVPVYTTDVYGDSREGLDRLTNTDYPAVVYSIGCDNTPFDDFSPNPWGWGTGYNLGQGFTIQNAAGGPAFLGNTRYGYVPTSHMLYRKFAEQITNGTTSLGTAELISKGNYGNHYLAYSHNLVGCPETKLWTAVPSTFSSATVTDNGNSITVNAGVGNSIIVVCSIDNGATYFSEVYSSNATFMTTVRPLYITITKQNYLPYVAVSGGNLTASTTFSGTLKILGNLTVNSSVTLTVDAGAIVNITPGKVIYVNGTLNAVGTSTSKITFDRVGTSGQWSGIQFNAGSYGNIQYANVSNASPGIAVYSSNNIKIENCSFTDCFNSVFALSGTAYIYKNIVTGSYYSGIKAQTSSNITLAKQTLGQGSNQIKDGRTGSYAGPAIYANGNSYVLAGDEVFGDCGYNSITNYPSFVTSDNAWVDGCYNWWGSYPPSSSGFITANGGTINYLPALSSAPLLSKLSAQTESSTNEKLSKALVLKSKGDFNTAQLLLEQLLEENNNNNLTEFIIVHLGDCINKLKGDFSSYSKNKKIDSKYQQLINELTADKKANDGEIETAIKMYEEIINAKPEAEREKSSLFKAAVLYESFKDDKQTAEKYYDELIKKYPEDELSKFIYLKRGQLYDAKNNYVVNNETETSESFSLDQNSPNPFNPTTKITFTLPAKDVVRLKVYDILGREVAVLADGLFETGKHEIEFNASRLPSGVYFYNLTTSSSSVTKKMLLLK